MELGVIFEAVELDVIFIEDMAEGEEVGVEEKQAQD